MLYIHIYIRTTYAVVHSYCLCGFVPLHACGVVCTYMPLPLYWTHTGSYSAAEASPPVPTEKKPLVPPGGIGLGSNVIAQMKRRHTHGKDLESDKERKEQTKAKSGSEHVEAVSPPKGDIPQPAKEEVEGRWSKYDSSNGFGSAVHNLLFVNWLAL